MAGRVGQGRRLKRGEVYLVKGVPLPDRKAGRKVTFKDKYVLLLYDESTYQDVPDTAVLVISTWKGASTKFPKWVVMIGRPHGMDHGSLIDCRWPFTMLKGQIRSGTHKTTLDDRTMEQVSVAITAGLQL